MSYLPSLPSLLPFHNYLSFTFRESPKQEINYLSKDRKDYNWKRRRLRDEGAAKKKTMPAIAVATVRLLVSKESLLSLELFLVYWNP